MAGHIERLQSGLSHTTQASPDLTSSCHHVIAATKNHHTDIIPYNWYLHPLDVVAVLPLQCSKKLGGGEPRLPRNIASLFTNPSFRVHNYQMKLFSFNSLIKVLVIFNLSIQDVYYANYEGGGVPRHVQDAPNDDDHAF